MHILIFIAVIGVISLLSVGYLANDVEVWIQQIGIGEGDIENPVLDTDLIIQIVRTGTPPNHDDFIVQCDFTSNTVPLDAGTKLFCKLYNGENIPSSFVIAEGFIELLIDYPEGALIEIPITTFSFTDANNVDFVRNVAVLVQNPPQ
ncbi:MAG: hypothetical protein ACREAK_06010 [Nitrosarchaeum sp.]